MGELDPLKKRDARKVFTPYLMRRQVLRQVEFTKMNLRKKDFIIYKNLKEGVGV